MVVEIYFVPCFKRLWNLPSLASSKFMSFLPHCDPFCLKHCQTDWSRKCGVVHFASPQNSCGMVQEGMGCDELRHCCDECAAQNHAAPPALSQAVCFKGGWELPNRGVLNLFWISKMVFQVGSRTSCCVWHWVAPKGTFIISASESAPSIHMCI